MRDGLVMAVVRAEGMVLEQKIQSGAADGKQRKKDGADGEFSSGCRGSGEAETGVGKRV